MQVSFATYPNDEHQPIAQKAMDESKQPIPEIAKRSADNQVKEVKQSNLVERPTQTDVSLRFSQDKESGRLVVELIDDRTGDSLRQIPTEAALRFSKVFGKIRAKFVDKQV
ncbi:MAG: flagellar protein FlaG [Acidobacteriota bacterium]